MLPRLYSGDLGIRGTPLEFLTGQLARVPYAGLHRSGRYFADDDLVHYSFVRRRSTPVKRIVMAKLAADSVTAALQYLDQARTALALSGGNLPQITSISTPPGENVVAYALFADTLIIWTINGLHVEAFRTRVDTLQLFGAIEQTVMRLERNDQEATVIPFLTVLYDWLLRPIERRLGDPGMPVVFVLDQKLRFAPFAALYDSRHRRYFIEDRPMRFAASLEIAKRRVTFEQASGVLLVADPAFNQRDYPSLNRLPDARNEVQSLADIYPGATVLEDSRATRSALDSAIVLAGITHFAGHAVFDDVHPDQSYLVLATKMGTQDKITVEELSRLDLRHLRLAVLSACRTARSGASRTGRWVGISDALLAAGAGGTVGTIWDVDDRSTAAFMIEFHQHYQRSHSGPAALREAQLALFRSSDSSLRSPAAWAAFRYTGR